MLARWLYTLLLYLLTVPMLARLGIRGLRNRDYWLRWRERLGFVPAMPIQGALWLHAVSVGEVNALARLIELLLRRDPNRPLIVTTGTPTGSARARQLFGGRVHHAYLPFDLPGAVRRFLSRIDPCLGVIAETEIWPNLYTQAAHRQIPLLIVNARLSERSMRGFAIMPGVRLIRSALEGVVAVLAQSETDAERYRRLGARPDRVRPVGNLKFDLVVEPEVRLVGGTVRAALGPHRPVWIAASTHEGEEQIVLDAHALVLKSLPEALLLVAPRHSERFRGMTQAARVAGLRVRTRSLDLLPANDTQCFVLDSLGELMGFYASADVAFVGGSLAPIGGHNVLEPAALGVPVLVGPNTFNSVEIVDALITAGAASRVEDADSLASSVLNLLHDEPARMRMGTAGLNVVERGRGALQEIAAAIEQQLAAVRRT